MGIVRDTEYIVSLIHELLKQPNETEWLEFKHNNKGLDLIGEYISSLSNSASLNGKTNAYLIWGIDDKSHDILGTTFKPSELKKGNEALENWLLKNLSPKIDFKFYEVEIDENFVVLLEIDPATEKPVMFSGVEYIRVGSYQKKLKDFPSKERELWRIFDKIPFEKQIAVDNLSDDEILDYLEYTKYFELLKLPLPENKKSILDLLVTDDMIAKHQNGKWIITNLGAILFAKDLHRFNHLKRKSIRVIEYKGNSKIETKKEKIGSKGYAVGFEGLIEYINNILPSNEIIGKVYRETTSMYPELAIRELVANAIIHQDFSENGTSIMIEIFENRIEITNPGSPIVDIQRFLDSPPKSRNELLASFLRRVNICEERGSGIDKVVYQTELFQLPAPIFENGNDFTKVTLLAHQDFNDMDKKDKIRATYLHASLKYIQREKMTNTSLRERFTIEKRNASMISRIIADSIKDKKIVIYDDTVGAKARTYVPWWAI